MAKKKVLIIDDEKLIVKSTSLALNFYGYDVVEAFDGKSGLDRAALDRPDLILLDIMMPGMDGWETLSNLKGNEITVNIPVVMFTAKEYSSGREMARNSGAADMVTKPFEPDDLHRVIQDILGE